MAELVREHGISEATLYTWKSKYGGLEVSEAQWLRNLEEENRRLKHFAQWKQEHNGKRPRSNLGYRTPNEFAEVLQSSVMTG